MREGNAVERKNNIIMDFLPKLRSVYAYEYIFIKFICKGLSKWGNYKPEK